MTRVGLLVFEGFDLLDMGGPYEVLLTANRLAQRTGATEPFHVVAVGVAPGPVTAYGGLVITPAAVLSEVGPLDVLVVPGAIDVGAALADPDLIAAVADTAATVSVTASVCTGAFALGRAGLLEDRAWTTHWEDVDALAAEVGASGARAGHRFVDDGTVVTGGGLSCGLDLGLHLVDRFVDRALALATARQLDHAWGPEGAPVPR